MVRIAKPITPEVEQKIDDILRSMRPGQTLSYTEIYENTGLTKDQTRLIERKIFEKLRNNPILRSYAE